MLRIFSSSPVKTSCPRFIVTVMMPMSSFETKSGAQMKEEVL